MPLLSSKRQQRHALAFDIDTHVERKPPILAIGDVGLPFAPGFDGPCPEIAGDFDLPARGFERRQASRNKLLPALGQVAAVEQKDVRTAHAAFGGKPHHRETASAQPIECGRLPGTVATVKDGAVGITGELPFVLQVDARLVIDFAIKKAKLGDIDRRTGPHAGRRSGLEQGQLWNWLALDYDRGGRG
jgi:hypothetical protein